MVRITFSQACDRVRTDLKACRIIYGDLKGAPLETKAMGINLRTNGLHQTDRKVCGHLSGGAYRDRATALTNQIDKVLLKPSEGMLSQKVERNKDLQARSISTQLIVPTNLNIERPELTPVAEYDLMASKRQQSSGALAVSENAHDDSPVGLSQQASHPVCGVCVATGRCERENTAVVAVGSSLCGAEVVQRLRVEGAGHIEDIRGQGVSRVCQLGGSQARGVGRMRGGHGQRTSATYR